MKSFKRLVTALAFTVAVVAPVVVSGDAYAAGQFSPRKITTSSSAPGGVSTDANGATVAKGSGGNGAFANHKFDFTTSTGGSIARVLLQYCTTPLLDTPCTAPSGMDASTVASVAAQSGFGLNTVSLDTTTVANAGGIFATSPCSGASPFRTNCILLQRTADTIAASTALSTAFGTGTGTDWIKNPTSNGTYFVRVYTFSDTGYATQIDGGGTAFAINTQIDITAKVQEKLNFSVAATAVTPGTSCSPLTGTGALKLGDADGVLDIATAYAAHSYFRVNTNATNGTKILYSGDTLKTAGGTDAITALTTTPAFSTPGTPQFGLGLDSANTQAGAGHSFTNLVATAPYDDADGAINPAGATLGTDARFAFDTTSVSAPKEVAGSTGTITCDTGSVRYLGNISTTTKAGVYKTTITYIAVPTY
ncbi:MAG TPA: hypothetical protein VK983_01215 [Candidatus Limnocylindrales bacterium]|nr:hypothetical protein [Candidatus Limnocylindrales bacterium]